MKARTLLAGMALLGGLGSLASGCTTEAFCFACGEEANSGGSAGAGGGNAGKAGSQSGGFTSGGMGGGTAGFVSGGNGGKAGSGGGAAGNCAADLQTDEKNCGACGAVCAPPGAFGECLAGKCTVGSCAEGFFDVDKQASNGCECKKSVEICDGVDNDCDGVKDNGFDTQADVNNCGGCNQKCAQVPNGTVSCVAGKCTPKCNPGFSEASNCGYKCPVTPPVAETCNGVDDDCDGVIDDGAPGANVACETHCPGGKCVGECKPGKTICTGTSKGLVCVNGIGPAAEVCDGKDNNCDGTVDEGYDLQNDPTNCGKCGVSCAANDKCIAGKCQFTCAHPYYDADKNPANGCEYKCETAVPGPETCNGKDDDCNGLVDDAVGGVGGTCDAGCPALAPCVTAGTCTATLSACSGTCCGECTEGQLTCQTGQVVCIAGLGPKLEVCDGKDNNCDGQIDEGFNLQTDPTNCGVCGKKCEFNNAVGACVNGGCVITTCKSGFGNVDNDASNGCEYTCPVNPTTSESCNGKDDDCDGQVDEDLVTPPSVCLSAGPCAGAVPTCQGATGWKCNYAGLPTAGDIELNPDGTVRFVEALCDGKDGNCNGQVDETFNVGQACSAGIGRCAKNALFVCKGDATGTVCPVVEDPTKAIDEQCNGIDDDCDGVIDEAVPVGSPTCYNGGAHPCVGWKDAMVKVGNVWVYAHEASHPGATGVDGGTDTSRACGVVGVQPWTSVNHTQAAAACAAVKNSAGQPMRLCTTAEWQASCAGAVTTATWSYPSAPGTFDGAKCNGVEKAVGAPWKTGDGPMCHVNGVYDLSGNVSEWVSNSTSVNGVTYYQVKGGAYSSYQLGTSCQFDFVLQQPQYAFQDLGFRCCSDAAP